MQGGAPNDSGDEDAGVSPRDARADAQIVAPVDALLDAFVPGRRRRISIDPARVTGTHAGFPLWFVITDADLAARALPDGSDLHFRQPGGGPLPYEVQRWDPASGSLEAWVRVDLADDTATELELVYGDPTLAHAPDAPMVFSQGFAAVWHLESATQVPDARGLRDGTPVGLSAANTVAARLGHGVRFTGGADEITFTNPITGGGPHTISLWVAQAATSDNDALVVLGNGSCGQSRWIHGRFDGPTTAVGFYCNDWEDPDVNVIGAGWTLLHWVYAGNQSRLYRDGALVAGPHTHAAINTQGSGGHLGNAPPAWGQNMGAHATLDEVRIATTARNAGWIATEYANQSAPQMFYSVGPPMVP